MKGYGPETFGELNAEDYDALHDPGTTDEAVALLAEIAPGKRVLELAIGTGRIALPLAAKGFEVSGIDASPDMLAKLKTKEGAAAIETRVADMASFDLGRRFDLVFLVFNTLFNLTTQESQVRCFARAAAHLAPGGHFLVETVTPDVATFTDHQRVKTRHVSMRGAVIEAARHDPVTQRIDYQIVRMTNEGTKLTPLP
ncbi:MAG: class I SAM-dependent methyltransferase, partial [Hyphomonadaceae bacterium]